MNFRDILRRIIIALSLTASGRGWPVFSLTAVSFNLFVEFIQTDNLSLAINILNMRKIIYVNVGNQQK